MSDGVFERTERSAPTEQRDLHDFREILVIALAGMLSDSDTVEDIVYPD